MKKHIATANRSRIIETSTKLRLTLLFLLGVAGTIGIVVYLWRNYSPTTTPELFLLAGYGIAGLAFSILVVWLDSTYPRELDIAVIEGTVHLSAQTSSFEAPRSQSFPLKHVKEVHYSAFSGLRLQIVDRRRMKLPKLGTREMRENMAIWFAETAGVELHRQTPTFGKRKKTN